MKKALVAVAASLSLFAVASVAHAEGDAAKGEKVWKKCKICHEIGEGAQNKVGPDLTGIIGHKAGAKEGFSYSQAMTERGAQGLVWTEENLSEFLTKPKKYIPGTKMTFAGLKKDSQRADVIAYLKTFSK